MLESLFTSISSVVNSFTGVLTNALTSVSAMFFAYDTESGLELTFLGTVAIIAVGAGLIWLVYRLIKGAIRGIGK